MSSPSAIAETLRTWLQGRLPSAANTWLTERIAAVAAGDKKALFLGFGLTARKTGKDDLALSPRDLDAAQQVRAGWDPSAWTVDQAARTLLILSYPSVVAPEFVATLDQLFAAGEVHELVALYQALPLYPHQAAFNLRCAEGIRTNIQAVFRAIAHRNPFPSEQLNEDQWNQLVLKCLFVGAPLDPVVGLDRRANPILAKMLTDFARERRAAKRPVSPELWRCVGPFADDAALDLLADTLKSGEPVERQAAALALQASKMERAEALLTASDVDVTPLSWTQIAPKS